MEEEEFRRKHAKAFGCFGFSRMHASALNMSETVTFHTLGPLQIDGAKMIHFVCAKANIVYLLA